MQETEPNFQVLTEHYEKCLEQYGPTPQGVDWPNKVDLTTRFRVMLGLIEHEKNDTFIDLLDLGCGYGALTEYLQQVSQQPVNYTGIDISEKMIQAARIFAPHQHFLVRDILRDPLPPASVDYVIMNGLFTEKRDLSWEAMCNFAQNMITEAFKLCRKGIAFNVMNSHVDWSRPDLFHWSFDDLTNFLFKTCSRHVILRADYGLYEYTTYVYKEPKTE